MLIPKLSIRFILSLTTAMALLFVVARQAMSEQEWAVALMAFVGLTLGMFLIYGLSFLLAYGANGILKSLSPPSKTENPFVVEGQYPPQQVPKNPMQDQV